MATIVPFIAPVYVPRTNEGDLTRAQETNAGQGLLQLQERSGTGIDRGSKAVDRDEPESVEREKVVVMLC